MYSTAGTAQHDIQLTNSVTGELSRHQADPSGKVVAAQGGPETIDAIC